ncbi:hypothetical protein [Actinosynnema sp. NPDC020468]|uniref:hypothetical protein n=1 Tax=Actinosynnema sp. NPDC020468 TaxID=3154488 RepID=UPI0033ED3261
MSRARVVLGGVLSGVLVGGSQGVLRGSVWVGLASGVAFGLVMAVVMRRSWGRTALRGLDSGRRRDVVRALRRGVPVEDPRLAGPLVDQADAVLSLPFPVTALRVVFGSTALLGLLVGVPVFLDRGVAGLLGGGPLLVLGLVLLFVVLPLARRRRDLVRRSRDATRDRFPESTVD